MEKLKVMGVSEVMGVKDVILLSLVEETKKRQLIVPCDHSLRKLFLMFIQHKAEADTLLPSVLSRVLASNDVNYTITIKNVVDGEFLTEILDGNGRPFSIRCSDAILLSMASNQPIYVPSTVMALHSMPFEEGAVKIGLPLTVLSEDMLKMSLEKAIQDENYEMASNLRDELKKRHSKNEQL